MERKVSERFSRNKKKISEKVKRNPTLRPDLTQERYNQTLPTFSGSRLSAQCMILRPVFYLNLESEEKKGKRKTEQEAKIERYRKSRLHYACGERDNPTASMHK